jgi:aspartyl/glutamyl-tRNA(Asn/Gln) amidotransferase C subunit
VVTHDDIVRAVRLARLELSPSALARLAAQVADILSHVEELGAIPVEGAEAVGGIAEGTAPRRPDEPGADRLHVAPAQFAPAWVDGLFTVPRLAAMEAASEAAP